MSGFKSFKNCTVAIIILSLKCRFEGLSIKYLYCCKFLFIFLHLKNAYKVGNNFKRALGPLQGTPSYNITNKYNIICI